MTVYSSFKELVCCTPSKSTPFASFQSLLRYSSFFVKTFAQSPLSITHGLPLKFPQTPPTVFLSPSHPQLLRPTPTSTSTTISSCASKSTPRGQNVTKHEAHSLRPSSPPRLLQKEEIPLHPSQNLPSPSSPELRRVSSP